MANYSTVGWHWSSRFNATSVVPVARPIVEYSKCPGLTLGVEPTEIFVEWQREPCRFDKSRLRYRAPPASGAERPDRYKWVALINTTLGSLMVTIDGTIVLIAMPDIFRGIGLNPLLPGNSFYLLWMILGFLVVTSTLVVSLGRLGDLYGRVKIYNLGFALFTFFSLLLSVTWMTGTHAALWLIIIRIFQGVGGAMLFAQSSAILTDAFPANQRGMALGINGVAGTSGTFIGLVLGGLLAPVSWRLVFLVSVPIGLFCTVWAYTMLHDIVPPRQTPRSTGPATSCASASGSSR